MSDMEHEPDWLTTRLLGDLELADRAAGVIDGDWGPDACLLARRDLEASLGLSPEQSVTDASYQAAAAVLRDAGRHKAAAAIDALAGAGWELDIAAKRWELRYAARAPAIRTQLDALRLSRSGRVFEHGRSIRGIDGAFYRAADLTPETGGPALAAVTVLTRGAGVEVITGFPGTAERYAWLADRIGNVAGPLGSVAAGPDSRTSREETALAWLLRTGRPASPFAAGLRADSFTTDARSEIFLTWRSVAIRPGEHARWMYAEDLRSRMLRAPGSAAEAVGWPDGDRAVAYLGRLLATNVTMDRGRAAIMAITREDTEGFVTAGRTSGISGPRADPGRRPATGPSASPPRNGPDLGPVQRI